MRLELFGCCKVEFDELSNFALFGLGFLLFLRLPCCAGFACCVGNIFLCTPENNLLTQPFLIFSKGQWDPTVLNQPGSPNALVVSSPCWGGLSPYHTQEAAWAASRHCVLSVPRWGWVVNVYVSLILIPVGRLGGSELPVRQQGLSRGWLVWKCFGQGRFAEVASWRGVVRLYATIAWQ